jgi:hypothetical protein
VAVNSSLFTETLKSQQWFPRLNESFAVILRRCPSLWVNFTENYIRKKEKPSDSPVYLDEWFLTLSSSFGNVVVKYKSAAYFTPQAKKCLHPLMYLSIPLHLGILTQKFRDLRQGLELICPILFKICGVCERSVYITELGIVKIRWI